MSKRVEEAIRKIPDFPKKGILFRDVTTAIKQPDIYKEIIDFFVEQLKDIEFDYITPYLDMYKKIGLKIKENNIMTSKETILQL